jgi:DNA-directed RNA polymerase subunit RPC12/RpoP
MSESHVRKCWECGNVATHESSITPGVLCKKCGSQDTRKVRDKKSEPKPGIKVTSVFGCSEIEVTDGVNKIAIGLTSRGVEQLIAELQIVLSMADSST